MKTHPNINGFTVLVYQGREISQNNPEHLSAVRKLNGPHHDSKWARHILGTDISQTEHRKRRGWGNAI